MENSQRYSFIIRIWFELEPTLEGFAPAMRGSIQPVGTEQLHYFTNIQHLTHTLETLTTRPEPKDLPGLSGTGDRL